MPNKEVVDVIRGAPFDVFPTNRLRYARTIRGLTQQELARRVGVTQGMISYIERGDAQRVKKETMKRISRALRISRRWLFDENGRLRP